MGARVQFVEPTLIAFKVADLGRVFVELAMFARCPTFSLTSTGMHGSLRQQRVGPRERDSGPSMSNGTSGNANGELYALTSSR